MQIEYQGVKPKVILMKVTSRGRPDQLVRCIEAYKNTADDTSAMVWLVSLDLDDKGQCKFDPHNTTVVLGQSESKISAINRDVELIKRWDILLNISDDQIPIVQGYDTIIRNTMPNDLDYSLWFNDGAQPRINTQEIIGYNYYKRNGYIYNPIYKSFYCDNEATVVAEKLGKLIKSDQCIIRHDHPACNHSTSIPNDALYDRNQKYWDEDKATWERRKNEL